MSVCVGECVCVCGCLVVYVCGYIDMIYNSLMCIAMLCY